MLADQNKYEEAEPIDRLVHEGGDSERVFWKEHGSTQRIYYKPANLLRLQERNKGAEAIYITEDCLKFEDDEQR